MHFSESTVQLPSPVTRVVDFFRQQAIWYVLSENTRATSCRDAASRRNRLGNMGIPLYDELKSLCVVADLPEGRQYALLHCRAHVHFDLDEAGLLLGTVSPLRRLSSEELCKTFGMQYGTVNPFNQTERFIQVFDEGLLRSFTLPHTMMTNAGDFEYGIEFRPGEMIDAVSHVSKTVIGKLVKEWEPEYKIPSFGIITGNGPESGIALWQYLNDAVYSRLSELGRMQGDLSYPRVLLHSLPEMGYSMELIEREDDVRRQLTEAVEQLCAAGIRYIALACNTTQYFGEVVQKIARNAGVDFISMADIVLDYIRINNITDLTIIGIPVVAGLGEYSAYRPLSDLAVHPVKDSVRPKLQKLGYQVKKIGRQERDSRCMNMLRDIINSGVTTDRVLIALTEISVLLQRFPKHNRQIGGKSIIDPLELYGEALAKLYLDSLPDWRESVYAEEEVEEYFLHF